MLFLSVIIPVFNESKRLGNLDKVISYLGSKKDLKSEIIVVNDGSSDNTLILLKKFKDIKIISYPQNRGKGFAVKTGMLGASGDFRLFLDVDLSTPIEELEKVLPQIPKFEVIIGSRKTDSAKVLIKQSILRENLGKGFTKLSQIILHVDASDFTCGFKCFSKEAADAIFNKVTIERWGFDSEILFLAKKHGYLIKEVPVSWANDRNTKVRFPQDIFNSFAELIKIRLNNLSGRYS